MTVAWFIIEDLGALVRRHRVDDSVSKAVSRITRTDLVIADDIGLLPVSPDAGEGFYRLVDAAYERQSLAVSSNLARDAEALRQGLGGALCPREEEFHLSLCACRARAG